MSAKVTICLAQKSKKALNGSVRVFYKQYSISGSASSIVIDHDKLCKSMADTVFKRIEAEKRGLSTGVKTSRPFHLSVMWNNKYILDTDKLCSVTGTEDAIKIKPAGLKKDALAEKQRFADTLKFIIESGQELDKDLRQCFTAKKAKKETDTPKDKGAAISSADQDEK